MSLFVTIEGIEGAGKSTLIDGLATALRSQNNNVITTREPGGTRLGKSIRELLLAQSDTKIDPRAELLLFAADRAQHIQELILPALTSGAIVICDRFTDSTLAYQGSGRGLDSNLLTQICNVATEGLLPQLTFLLDLDPEIGLTRAKTRAAGNQTVTTDRFESQTLDFHRRIREGFLALARNNSDRFVILNATDSPETLVTQALSALTPHLRSSSSVHHGGKTIR